MESSLPVVFSSGAGDGETDIGTILVDASTDFHRFAAKIGRRIGVDPHQISLSLVRRRKGRWKTPIDETSNFTEIARAKDVFVLAVLRRRRPRPRRSHVDARSDGKIEILRRPETYGLVDPIGRLYEAAYLSGFGAFPSAAEMTNCGGFCEVCEREWGSRKTPAFHLCVYDPVVFGFRTAAGPIERPGKV